MLRKRLDKPPTEQLGLVLIPGSVSLPLRIPELPTILVRVRNLVVRRIFKRGSNRMVRQIILVRRFVFHSTT